MGFHLICQDFLKCKSFTEYEIIEKELNKFFVICKLSEHFEIISFNDIIYKCVLVKNNDEYFLSTCNELSEHANTTKKNNLFMIYCIKYLYF